jgi:hypothetical protein
MLISIVCDLVFFPSTLYRRKTGISTGTAPAASYIDMLDNSTHVKQTSEIKLVYADRESVQTPASSTGKKPAPGNTPSKYVSDMFSVQIALISLYSHICVQ